MSDLVSIIMPCFNVAEFVAQSVESALAQTYDNFEVIAVNDGSTDETLSILKRYNVKVVDQTNKGLAGARNAGVMNSSGKFLLPLDADDLIDPDYIKKTIALMDKNVGIVSTDMQCFGICNDLIRMGNISLSEEMTANKITVTSLIRREAFLETGGYNPQLKLGYEDFENWINILKRGWTHRVVNEPLFKYRRRTQSMITEAGKRHNELMEHIKRLNGGIY